MSFKDGEMIVEETPVMAKSSDNGGLSSQDRLDMAEVGKKQQFNVSSSFCKKWTSWLIQVEKLWFRINAG